MRTAIGLAMALGKYIQPGKETEVWNLLHHWPDSDTSSETPASAVAGADTEAVSETTPTTGGTEISPPPSSQTQVSDPAGTGSANEDGAEAVIASDDPVKDMPMKSSARANIRMGRTADGKSRP